MIALAFLVSLMAGEAVGAHIRPGAIEVVVDPASTPTVRFAGVEATNLLSQVLGGDVPLVSGPTGDRTHIFLGDSRWSRDAGLDVGKLKRDAFYTCVRGEDVFLLGRDDPKEDPQALVTGGNRNFLAERATLSALYDFLERYADCRFFFPGELGTIVPRKTSIDVPDCSRMTAPHTDECRYTRNPGYCGSLYDRSFHPWGIHGVASMRWRLPTGLVRCCHGLRSFHYVRRFAKEHPDWFCLMRDGARNLLDTEAPPFYRNGKLCYSSPIREEIYRDVKAYLTGAAASTRGLKEWGMNCVGDVVDVMPEDGFSECFCPACQKSFSERCGKDRKGSYANDLIWGLTREIGCRLKAEGIKGSISQMAYYPYAEVPSFDLPDNIHVMVATPGPWDVVKPDAFTNAVKKIRAWHKKTGMRVQLWTYPGLYYGSYPNIPIVCPRAWAKFYKTVAPDARFGYAETMCGRFAYDILNLYMLSRLVWDPNLDPEAVLNDYHARLFGSAREPMKRLFDLLEEKWIGGVCAGGSVMTDIGPIPIEYSEVQLYSDIYTEAFFREVDRILAQAERLTVEGTRERRAVDMFARELIQPMREARMNLDSANELRRRAERRPVNLLENGDFADGRACWHTETHKSPPSFDTVDKLTGAASCVLTASNKEPGNRYTYANVFHEKIQAQKDKTYRLSYFMKYKNVVSTPESKGRDSGVGGVIWLPGRDYSKFPAPMPVGTHDWVHLSHTVKPTKDGELKVEFRIVQATGEMRVCGVLLEEVKSE